MAAPKNPKGAKSDKLWRDAIMRAVRREIAKGEKTKRLETLADALVAKGIKGDVPALKEIGDRLDGRPTQGIEHGGEVDHNVIFYTIYEAVKDDDKEDED